MDYVLSSTVTVTPNEAPVNACANLTVIDDTSLEGFHNFSVGVASTSLNTSILSVPSDLVMIQIQDDESESKVCP